MSDLYFLRYNGEEEHEVTKEEFVRAERAAGFHNTLGQPDEPATAGFGSGGVHGHVLYVNDSEEKE